MWLQSIVDILGAMVGVCAVFLAVQVDWLISTVLAVEAFFEGLKPYLPIFESMVLVTLWLKMPFAPDSTHKFQRAVYILPVVVFCGYAVGWTLPMYGAPTVPVSADKAEIVDINKEQWVIDLRAKVKARKAACRAFEAAKAQIVRLSNAYDAQNAQLEQRANTIDIQNKALKNAEDTRDRQAQTLADLKAKVAALEAKEMVTSKLQAQLTGEKQHLLHALTNSQHTVQGARSTIRLRDTEITTLRTQLARHSEQQESITTSAQKASEAEMQLNTTKRQLENVEMVSAQHLHMMQSANSRLHMLGKAMASAGMPCDLWQIPSDDLVAKLQHAQTSSSSEQEAKLAESCAELSASNADLKYTLSAVEAKLTTTSADLLALREKHHNDFRAWQQKLCEAHHALAAAKQEETPSHRLQKEVAALQTRLASFFSENQHLRDAKVHEEAKVYELALQLATQITRTKTARESLDRCVKLNCEQRKSLGAESERVKDLESRLEEAEEGRHAERGEVQRLTWIVEAQIHDMMELEAAKEKLERDLMLGGEFVKVTEGDVCVAEDCEREEEEEEEEEEQAAVVQEDVDFDDEFEFEQLEFDRDEEAGNGR